MTRLRYGMLLVFLVVTQSISGQYSGVKTLKLMGCQFTIRVVADSEEIAWTAINRGIEEISRIETLISSWDPNSQTSKINNNSGILPVSVDRELFDLIKRSLKVSELTHGAFDISFASMDRIYHFDGEEKDLPSNSEIAKAKSLINWKNVILDETNSTVFLTKKGMKIGFGGIGKGYAANRAKQIMESLLGVQGGIVNASGDLSIWGSENEDKITWDIKILDPSDPNNVLAVIPTNNTSVVTSGDYEKYFMNNGKRYAHIIDPISGIPTTGIKSVTIICKDAEIADALATSVFILGKEDGLYLINNLKGVEGLLVTDDNQLLKSENIQLDYN